MLIKHTLSELTALCEIRVFEESNRSIRVLTKYFDRIKELEECRELSKEDFHLPKKIIKEYTVLTHIQFIQFFIDEGQINLAKECISHCDQLSTYTELNADHLMQLQVLKLRLM